MSAIRWRRAPQRELLLDEPRQSVAHRRCDPPRPGTSRSDRARGGTARGLLGSSARTQGMDDDPRPRRRQRRAVRDKPRCAMKHERIRRAATGDRAVPAYRRRAGIAESVMRPDARHTATDRRSGWLARRSAEQERGDQQTAAAPPTADLLAVRLNRPRDIDVNNGLDVRTIDPQVQERRGSKPLRRDIQTRTRSHRSLVQERGTATEVPVPD